MALLLLLSLSLVLIHQHPDGAGKDCGLCDVQRTPGLHSTSEHLLATPALYEWRSAAEEPSLESSSFVPTHRGRAPPRSFSSIFV